MHDTVPKLMELFSDPAGLDFLVSSVLDPVPQVPISATGRGARATSHAALPSGDVR